MCEEVCTLPACQWMCELEAHAAAAAGPSVEGWGVFTCSCRSYAECNSFQLGFPLPQLSSARCFRSLSGISRVFFVLGWSGWWTCFFFFPLRWKVMLLHVCTSLRQSSYLLCLSWFQKTHIFTSTSGIKERFPSCYSMLRNPEVDLFDHIFLFHPKGHWFCQVSRILSSRYSSLLERWQEFSRCVS